ERDDIAAQVGVYDTLERLKNCFRGHQKIELTTRENQPPAGRTRWRYSWASGRLTRKAHLFKELPMADASPGTSAPSSNRNVMIVLSYLWLLALVPLLTEKEDREVQWHAKHGIVLMVAELALWIVISIMLGPLGIFGCIAALFMPLLALGELVLHVM